MEVNVGYGSADNERLPVTKGLSRRRSARQGGPARRRMYYAFRMPGYGARYWADRTADNRRRAHPKIKGAHKADAVVIGGGLTGATAAYVLASGGLDVVLVEAEEIAAGSTAGSPGIIAPEPDAWVRTVEPEAGRFSSRTAWNEAQKAAGDFARALRKLDIKCDLADAPYLINARSSEEAAGLKKEMAVRRAAGVPALWATPQAVRAETHLDTAGALKLSAGFTYDPVRAALGLVAAAEKSGAKIFEQSTVRRTTFTRKYADVILKDATIRTTGIVVATGEPGTVFSQLRRHVRRSTGYVVVTEPLSAAMRREAGKRAAIVTEASDVRPWMRWLADDRLLFAGGLSSTPTSRLRDKSIREHTAELMYGLSVRYPAISGLPARWAWDTEVVTAVDGLPWIGPHRNYPFHFFSMAFGWHGDSLAWHSARAALRFFKGEATREDAALGFARYLG